MADLGAADPSTLASAMELFAPLARYHRLEVRGLDRIKPGPALFVANHSGGLNPVDALFLFRYYEQRGYDDPIYVLGHDLLFEVPRFARTLRAIGALRAAPQQAQEILRAGRKLLVFPEETSTTCARSGIGERWCSAGGQASCGSRGRAAPPSSRW